MKPDGGRQGEDRDVHAADGEHGGIGQGQGKGNKETEKEN